LEKNLFGLLHTSLYNQHHRLLAAVPQVQKKAYALTNAKFKPIWPLVTVFSEELSSLFADFNESAKNGMRSYESSLSFKPGLGYSRLFAKT